MEKINLSLKSDFYRAKYAGFLIWQGYKYANKKINK